MPDPSPSDADRDPLQWLAERPEYPKVLVWDRDRDEWAAGAGAAEVFSPREPVGAAELERQLGERVASGDPEGPGWIGALRFAPARPASPTWSDFGAGWWIRPEAWWIRRQGEERRGREDAGIATDPGPAPRLAGEDPALYLTRVRAALDEIASSSLEKIVLARLVRRTGRIDPVRTLARMAASETGGTLYWIALDADQGFLGLTPETLYRRRGNAVETEALAATAGPTEADGRRLLADEKSLREHGYVRDAIVHALRPISTELDVAPEPRLRRLARLHHLRTPIRARLREPGPILARLHPTPAVCGTPFAEAEAAIARLERHDRGLYAGAVGWWHPGGESIHVALRGARYTPEASAAYLGAGIVRGSVPEDELHELDLKAAALFEAWTDAEDGAPA